MVRVIKQETYDEVVKENIQELSMSPEEAIEDAIKQFEAQGIDLSNIIKDLALNDNSNVIKTCLEKLSSASEEKTYKDVTRVLETLKTELDKDIAHRVFAGKENAYSILLALTKDTKDDVSILKPALKAMTSLMTGNPDLLDSDGIDLQMQILDTQTDVSCIQNLLRWIKECCIKHEMNRQRLVEAQIIDRLIRLLKKDDKTSSELRDICNVIRALVLDDDLRLEFGKAHEHASLLARASIGILTNLLSEFKDDEAVVGDLMATLASLVVRNEFCQEVEDAGGLTFILDVMINHADTEKLNGQALKLLSALAGNDNVKSHIVTCGSCPLIVSAISRFKSSESVVAAGFSCISALTLRSSSNAGVFYDCGAPVVILDAMKQFPKSQKTLRHACRSIRNMAVKNRAESREFLAYGVESLLTEAIKLHGSAVEAEAKAALRDLGLKVDLKEQWTGKGISMKN
ncbi:armadillo repeat-containing protein 6 homolog [Microplitis demolitor]|uniref:armadillo repeat-containing protein 6 homolog n=1 Tax=Microplitis demolitor TaxID=69319 RepID=UPI0004CD701B|nr:armadillo repeat-containing protein 6 homolog [Microplitis demolitor]XP_008554567.1 armadillo repeat-containing protein 6 homolog [Microplitis demolitor]XP_053593434.1 armadillo repeat-containing protein 6 homolog [Microplitis demolitor]